MAFYLSRALAYSSSRSVCLRSPKLKVLDTERVPSGVLSLLALPATVHLSYRYLSSSSTKLTKGSRNSAGSYLPGDISKPEGRVEVVRHDQPIIQQISQFEFSSTSDFLCFLETVDTDKLDIRAIEVISRVLEKTLKNEPYESRKKLLKSVGMQIYCHRILRTCGTMDDPLLFTLIKLLVFMGANGNHKTFQTLLRLISDQALEPSQIGFLKFLIDSLRPEQTSTLSEAIRVTLPLVLKSQATMKIIDAGTKVLIDCLFTNSRDGTLTKVIDKILSLHPTDFTLAQAVDIHKFCAGHEVRIPRQQSLLELSYGIFTANMHMIDEIQMSLILQRSARRVIKGHLEFYNEDFLDACCSRLADSRKEYHILRCLAPISSLRHVNIEFLERCAEIAARVPQRILKDNSLFFALIRGFSDACYKPENWNILQPMMLEHPATTTGMSKKQIYLILDYLALDTLPLNILERIFSPGSLDLVDASLLKKCGHYSLTVMYAAIKQLCPEYSGPLPPKSVIDAWQEARSKQSLKFRHTLEGSFITALGGESYVLTGLTQQGIYIDHCIVMRKGGYPVAMQQCQYSCLDEIQRPEGSTLVLVKVHGKEAYSINTRRLRGIHYIESKIVKSFGHPVVEVDLQAWRDLTEAEKIPHLAQKLRENVDKIQI